MKAKILLPITILGVSASAQSFESPAQATAAASGGRPRTSESDSGYIDNAIIGSQIRLRFDAAFHVDSPDRAEFFYAKCGCYKNDPTSKLYDKHSPGPPNGIVTNLNFQEFHLMVEYAPMKRFSLFADVPERSLQVQQNTAGQTGKFSSAGIGDFQAGFKAGLIANETHVLTFQFRTYSPTGDARIGLGTNHVSVEPGVLYFGRPSPRTSVAGQLLVWQPIDGAAGFATAADTNNTLTSCVLPNPPGPPKGCSNTHSSFAGTILNYGVGGSYTVASLGSTRVAPVLEFVGWTVLDGFRTTGPTSNGQALPPAYAGGDTIVNAKLGVRTSFGRNSIYIGYGHALTPDIWYKQIVRLEYRYAF